MAVLIKKNGNLIPVGTASVIEKKDDTLQKLIEGTPYSSLDLVISSGTTRIRSYAFYYNSVLKSIIIPDNVTSLGSYAFYNCTGLTSATIENGVTSIGSNTFQSCSSLTSIIIGNSVTSIGSSAFYSCVNITSITIPDGVTYIGSSAFQNCSKLTSITIPDGVTSILGYTFNGCHSLSSITLQRTAGVVSLGNTNAIPYSSTQHITIYVPSDLISSYQTASNWSTLYNNGYITFSAIGGQNG